MLAEMEKPMSRVFNYSLDWRFLLPSDAGGKIRVVLEKDDTDLSEALERVGIPVANQFSFSDINQNGKSSAESLVIPFGLPVRWVGAKQEDQLESYRSIQRLIGPGGYLLMGFNNSWDFRSKTQSNYHSSTPRRVAYQLKQAGFKSIKIFGAIPNLSIPEYIFDLNVQAIRFALSQCLRRKPAALNILQVLSRTIGLAGISNFLPCYFAVAAI